MLGIMLIAARSDVAIALSFEVPPYLQNGPEFEFRDMVRVPFRVSLNTPLVPTLASFSRCAEALHLHQATAQILDDMRFLLGLVLALPKCPSEKDLQKVQSTSAWVYERISNLAPEGPVGQRQRISTHHPRHARSSAASSKRSPSRTTSRQSSRRPSPTESSSSANLDGAYLAYNAQDIMYQAVRRAALIYTRAIMARRRLGDPAVCSEVEFLELWTTVWKVPLRSWKMVLGVFVWIMLSMIPASRGTRHERFVKSMLTIGLVQMALEDWEVAEQSMKGALSVVAWLVGSNVDEAGEAGKAGDADQGWLEPKGKARLDTASPSDSGLVLSDSGPLPASW